MDGKQAFQRFEKDMVVVRGRPTPSGVHLLEPWCIMCQPRVPAICWTESR